MLGRFGLLTLAALTASCGGEPSQIRATGSSTVFPFTKVVADAFVKAEDGRKAPTITSTGTGAGIKAFCESAGPESFDIVDASRRMTRAEFDRCRANRVGDIIEIPIGLDGVALAESSQGPKLRLSRKDIYLALAANPMGEPNTAETWADVNPRLPATPIRVLGPPSTSATRASFVDLLLQPGCMDVMPAAKELRKAGDPALFESACRQIRGDGAYVEGAEDDSVIVRNLSRDPNAIGVFGYSYLSENADRLQGVPVDDQAPTYDAIASGEYPGVRTLYIYVKKRSLEEKPELREFLDLYTAMSEPDGPLTKRGLITPSERVRRRAREAVQLAPPLEESALL